MKKALAGLFLILSILPASAQKSKSALQTEINTSWPDNNTGQITPKALRGPNQDIVNSYLDLNGASSFACPAGQVLNGFTSLSTPVCISPALSLGLTVSHIFVGSAGNLASDVAMSGDCAMVVSGAITCTKSNGVAFSASATGGLLTAAQFPALTGDVTTVAGSLATTLATVNANVGTFGSSVNCTTFTVNAKGLITAASQTACTPTVANIAGFGSGVSLALTTNVGTAGSFIINGGVLGTPSSGTLTNTTGFPVANLSGASAGCLTWLATASSANLRACITDETGTGLAYFQGGALGTPSSGTLTNATGLPIGGISATGTPSSTTFLRGDGTWNTPAGGGTITNVTAAGIITASPNPIISSGTININASIFPQSRITLSSGVPVLTGSVSGATTVFVTPYVGNLIPIYDGTNLVPTAFAEVSQTTTDTTKSPAAVAASSIYDIFCWIDSGTNRCTRGPAWTNSTTRSLTLTRTNGILLNTSSITNGPAALRGTYVGTIASNASSTIDYIFGSAASGGVASVLNIWNMYNRVNTSSTVIDNGVSYTYTTNTTREARGSTNNQISFVVGQQEDSISVSYTQRLDLVSVAAANARICIGLDSTAGCTNPRGFYSNPQSTNVFSVVPNSAYQVTPSLGTHVISANESGDGVNANTFSADQNAVLSIIMRN